METPLQSATRFCTPSESAKIRKKYAPPNTVHVGPISQMCRVGYVARTYRVNEASSAQLADVPSAACQAARATRVASGAAGKSTCLRLVQRLLLLHSNGTSFLDEEAAYAQVAKQHPKECGALARRGAGSALGRCCQVPMEVDGDPSTAATFLVGLVMPIHPPHFAYGVHFIASMALHGHTRARGTRVEYFPVLSSVADRDGFRQSLATAAATGTHAPLSGQSVSGRDHGPWIFSGGVAVHPLLVALDAAPAGEYGKLAPATTKKLLGVREAFAQRRALRYALAIDAEVEFVSDHSFVHTLSRWSAAREVIAAPTATCPDGHVPHSHRETTQAACAAVGLPSQPFFYWWSSAPVYAILSLRTSLVCPPRIKVCPPHLTALGSTWQVRGRIQALRANGTRRPRRHRLRPAAVYAQARCVRAPRRRRRV